MLRKLLTGLLVVFVGALALLTSPLHTNAATYPYDGKNPYATGCSSTEVTKYSKSFSYQYTYGKYISGTVYLKFSTSCKTAWSYVKINSALPSGYFIDGTVTRNTDGKFYRCEDGGNGAILPGQTSCYSGMVYDLDPNTAYASATIYKVDDWDGYVVYQSGKTASY
ncbi:DUF2690 domain-containing protein [Shimazuella kribbensis]|uniref:DUF2690 domain-containing protein n=1 Tax=Shimazuella kribbensis TaxID=139808 RepID=UPI0003F76D9D|nr:DUF2690 domain-containing protein [Shimazuella kribbensis]